MVGLFGQLLPTKATTRSSTPPPAIRARVPGTRFVFVGALENPPYEAHLRARLATAGLTDAFQFTGWRTDVPDVMRAVDLLVVPTTSQEPAALSLMEGMAMGRPLVASRTGGTPELIVDGETGLIFPPGDAAALARQMAALLLDPAPVNRWAKPADTGWNGSSPSNATSPRCSACSRVQQFMPLAGSSRDTTRFWTAFEE